MARLIDCGYGQVGCGRFPCDSPFIVIAKERIAMAFSGTTRWRRGKASGLIAGATALSLCTLGAYWAPQAASAASAASVASSASAAGANGANGANGAVADQRAPAAPRAVTVLPDGRYVRPAGIKYNLGDFSLGLAIAPNGRCAASSDEGWGNGRPVPAVPKVNPAGTEPDEGVT